MSSEMGRTNHSAEAAIPRPRPSTQAAGSASNVATTPTAKLYKRVRPRSATRYGSSRNSDSVVGLVAI